MQILIQACFAAMVRLRRLCCHNATRTCPPKIVVFDYGHAADLRNHLQSAGKEAPAPDGPSAVTFTLTRLAIVTK